MVCHAVRFSILRVGGVGGETFLFFSAYGFLPCSLLPSVVATNRWSSRHLQNQGGHSGIGKGGGGERDRPQIKKKMYRGKNVNVVHRQHEVFSALRKLSIFLRNWVIIN